MVTSSDLSYVRDLVARFEFLRPLLHDHLAHYNEILSHLFFGDMTEYIISRYEDALRGDDAARKDVNQLLAALEEGYVSGDGDVRDLISDSFLENLPWRHGESGWGLREILGPALTERLSIIG